MKNRISANDTEIVIVVSEFNKEIIENLLKGALKAFYHYNGNKENIRIFKVPGALEIPGTIKRVLKHYKPNAVIAIGAVIRGETPHFNFVAHNSAKAITEISCNTEIPIINAILTTENAEQARERSKDNIDNKGWVAIESALQTIAVYKEINSAL